MALTLDGTDGASKLSDAGVDDQGLYDKENILGTVSQSGGIPTGAIIEEGSNANGLYTKFADGTMVCTDPRLSAAGQCDVGVGNVFRTPSTTWTYPAVFSSTPTVSSHGGTGLSYHWVGLGVSGNTTTTATFCGYSPTTTSLTPELSVIAIGRWF